MIYIIHISRSVDSKKDNLNVSLCWLLVHWCFVGNSRYARNTEKIKCNQCKTCLCVRAHVRACVCVCICIHVYVYTCARTWDSYVSLFLMKRMKTTAEVERSKRGYVLTLTLTVTLAYVRQPGPWDILSWYLLTLYSFSIIVCYKDHRKNKKGFLKCFEWA